jgi:hypothetical protein
MEMMNRLTRRSAIRLFAALSAAVLLAGGSSIRPTVEAQANSNPIVTENSLAGSPQSEWDIQGAGDPTLQGFATDISVNVGSVVSFKIKTSAPGYVIDIYRLGYYQGFGARKVASITPTAAEVAAAQTQPDCATDAASGLVDCGTWAVTGSWDTTGVNSGIFIAKLSRSDNLDASSHIYFIVRDDSRTSEILFQTSDTTWQAYNQYGGNSLYCGGPFSNSAGRYSCQTRAGKVSYNRPFDTRAHDPQSFLFNAEYPMVRWLEANGYDVKYWTGVDTDRFGVDPAIGLTSAHRPKAFFSVGHDEYWSAQQRAHVESARNSGVNLAFFSGNEMFWKTRYESSIDGSNTSFRTLVSYKETFGAGSRVDPNPANPWTGTWRDPRFPAVGGGNPENALIGQLWMVNCCSDRIHVPSSMAGLRFWRNTGVADLAPGDTTGYRTSLESLGYEWDEVIDNGALPAGLVRMSTTTLVVPERVVDYGINIAQGTATHSLTLYRHNSGALVFGAGTVQWSWGLDSIHDRTPDLPPDQAMQQATVNLLADMGAQPRTLQVGANPSRPLVTATMSSDIFAPTSTIVSPAAGSSVESGARVTISGTTVENGGGTVAGVEVSVDNGTTWRTANLLPSGVWNYDWTPGSLGTATIRSRAFDDSGNLEGASSGITVSIVAGPCPCTSLWRPANVPTVPSAADNNAVELGTKFYSDIDGFITGVRFYKGTPNTGTHVGNLWSSTGTRLATVTFTNETASGWQQANFDSAVQITANTTYIVSYHTNVGSYAADGGYFTASAIDSPPLHAPTSAAGNGNGLFAYGVSQFPTNTFNATNYWVDVVFAPTLEDSTPPVISLVKSTIVDSSRVTITWTTNEDATSKIQYSTDPEILSSTSTLPPDTQTVSVGTFVTQHSIGLSGLTPNTTYYYRVISVDRSGNEANIAAPSVTVPGPTLRDTSTPDFNAGTGSGTYTSETADGEVILAPATGAEFSGSALSPGWIDVPYADGGAAFVGNGVVLVDGSRLGTCADVNGSCQEQWALTPGHRLEFIATFTGDAFQHSGLAQDFGSSSQPWAIFSTLSGGVLTARTNTGVASQETFLGNGFLGSSHRYAIDWTDTSVVYSVDGVVVATHNLAVAGPMRPIAASDFSVFGGNVVIDWMRLGPYAASGEFHSRVFDANAIVNWRSIQWKASTPPGTSVAIGVRTGSTPDAEDGTWSAWASVASPGPLALSSRYIQYRAVLATADPAVTPDLQDVIVSTGQAPVAVNDSIIVPENGTVTLPATGPGSLVANDTDADNDALEVVAAGPASHGTVLVNFDGSVRYTPAANYNGPDSFVYTVSDGLLTSSAVVSIDVRFGNIPPVANNDFYTTAEETTLIVAAATGILRNDTDMDGDALSAILVTTPAHGALALNSSGAFTYTPNPNYAGPDTFTYRVTDGQASSDPATVQIQITQVNDPPVTEADAYTAVLDQPLHVGAPGVLANDHDIEVEDTTPLHAQLVSGPANGTLTLNSDGSFDYTPNADFLGIDQFTYASVDHFSAVGNTATVTITVALKAVSQAVNGGGTVSTGTDVTSANPLASSVTSPTAATIRIAQGVIAGSQPPSGYTFLNQQVNITVLNPDGTELTTPLASPLRLVFAIDSTLLLPGQDYTTFQIFRNGILIPECPGQTSIPAANLDPCVTAREGGAALNGDARLTIISSHASKWNLGLSSEALGDAPFAQNDGVYQVDFQTPLVIPAAGVLGNDYARDGLTAVLSPGSEIGGTVSLAPSGAFTFTPNAGACGNASFRYTATDGTNSSNEATVSILIDCLPRAGDDTVTVLEDSGTSTITVLSNDTDPDPGQTLTIISVSSATHGVTSIVGGGMAVSYAPQPDYFGADSFTYTISDGRGGTASGTVSLNVLGINDVPSFTKGANQSVNEDGGPQSVTGWATNASAGPANESQLLDYIVANDNNALFASQPGVASNGTLAYTPAADANGTATVTVRIHDDGGVENGGVDTSAPQTFTITVNPINDAPSFTKGANQSVNEDAGAQSVPNWATNISAGPVNEASQTVNFIVSSDNPSLFAAQPAIDADGTLTYTAASDANGSALVTVRLHDSGGTASAGSDTSAAETFTIAVGNVNDAPSFTKGADQIALEDAGAQTVLNWATNISRGPADETGQALNFIVSNTENALFAVQPAIAADGTLTFTPAANANGTATITVQLHDDGGIANGGVDTSAAQTFTITIVAVNDAPSFTKGADQVVNEDAGAQTVLNWATALSAGPANESSQVLNFIVSSDASSLFAVQPAIAADGTLTYTAAANASGSAVVTVRVRDDGGVANSGVDTSAPQTFTITVNPVNDAPSFTKGADQIVLEDAPAGTVLNWATNISAGSADESGQALNFIVSNDANALFSVQPAIGADGTLTFTPAANANGSATVIVRLHDDGGTASGGEDTSAAQTFTITLTAVNDAPSFVRGANQSVNEDAGAQSVAGWATAISAGPANESAQALNFLVSNDANALFAVQPAIAANGTLTYTPAANVSGSATVTVRLHDDSGVANGGVDTSAAQTFTIIINAVNDAPTFAKGADQAVLEDAAAQTVVGWATGMSAGPADESAQTLNFLVSNNNPALFAVQPAIAADGTLTYTPAANANGSATVTVRLHDNGGTGNGGVDTSAPQTFTIALNPINDVPSFVKGANQTVNEDAGAQSIASWATAISGGPANENAQALNFIVSNDANALFAVQPAVAADGTLTFTPAANANGSAAVTVQLHDNGGTANGGVDISATQTFTITVTSVNDAPSFVKGADVTGQVDTGAQTVAGWATALSAGPSDENGQALNFIVSNSNNALFAVQPAVTPNGTLSYTTTSSVTGTAIVTVQLHDNGGTANGGVDTSAAQTFTITINPKPSLTISDSSVYEGNSGQTPAVFNVDLSSASPVTITVDYQTFTGTAATPKDYITTSGTLTFAPGEVSRTVTVMVVGETMKEKDETFSVRLANPVNATIADAQGLGIILDDDSTPRLSATSTSLTEGTGGQKNMTFAVSPTNANQETMTVDYVTVVDSTTSTREGIDYVPVTGTITFPAESTDPVLVTVPIVGDRRHEKTQRLFLHLLNAVQAVTGADGEGDIEDDDPIPSISVADVTVGAASSGTVNAVLTVTLSNDSDDLITVNYSTADGSAIAGTDYASASGVLTFQPGETSHVITLVVNPEAYAGSISSFAVNLSAPSNTTLAKSAATVTIMPPSAWVTSTAAEFNSGSLSTGASVTETLNGELTLTATVDAEFSGTALPAGWTNTVITSGGSAAVGGGVVTVDGSSLLWGTTYTAGRTLEFSATFVPTANQNVGFGVTSALIPPFAMFGVKADGKLYARSVAPGQAIETPLTGTWFGAPHRFRIDWNASTVDYWIDGTKVVSHAITFTGKSGSMRPAITDLGIGDGALTVDWIRMTPYATTGTYTSPIYDAGVSVAWQTLSFVADLPSAATAVSIEVRTGETATPDASWSAFRALASGAQIGTFARYAQYRVTLTTTAAGSTPTVKEVALAFVK